MVMPTCNGKILKMSLKKIKVKPYSCRTTKIVVFTTFLCKSKNEWGIYMDPCVITPPPPSKHTHTKPSYLYTTS